MNGFPPFSRSCFPWADACPLATKLFPWDFAIAQFLAYLLTMEAVLWIYPSDFFWEKLVRYSLIQSSSLLTGISQVFQLDTSAMGAKVEFWRAGHRLEPNEVWRSVIRTKHLPECLKAITFNRNSIHDIHVSLSILGLEVSLANLEEHSLGYSSGLYHTWVGRADDLPSPASFSQMTVIFSWKIYNRKCQPICIIEMKEALRMNKKLREAVSYMVKKKLKAEQLKKLKALKSIFKRFI